VHKLFSQQDRRRGARRRAKQARTDPAADLIAIEKDIDQGRRAHRFHTVGRDHRHFAGNGSQLHFVTQVLVLTSIAVLMTVGVYGLVGGIIKLDDAGLRLSQRSGDAAFAVMQRGLGGAILPVRRG
jgi:predicted DNA repair protein MutK